MDINKFCIYHIVGTLPPSQPPLQKKGGGGVLSQFWLSWGGLRFSAENGVKGLTGEVDLKWGDS